MAKRDSGVLIKVLKPFPKEVAKTALSLREFVWDLYPESNELIYDNYNAVAIGWSVTDRVSHVFCNIAVGRSNHSIQFGFYWGSKIADPEKKLIGNGNQYRYFRVVNLDSFPRPYIKKLMKVAYHYSLSLVKDRGLIRHGQTIMKSISEKKRPAKKIAVKATANKTRKRKNLP